MSAKKPKLKYQKSYAQYLAENEDQWKGVTMHKINDRYQVSGVQRVSNLCAYRRFSKSQTKKTYG